MYSGIAINDTRLLVWVIAFSGILLFTVILGIFACVTYHDKENAKNAKRIRALREKALTDPVAQKRLEKLERKNKRNIKNNLFEKAFIISLLLVLVFVNLLVCVIPGWTDYITKDYAVYSGNVSVDKVLRTSQITLEDGTVLTGSLGLEKGQHNIQLVYSKRTKIALGMKQES